MLSNRRDTSHYSPAGQANRGGLTASPRELRRRQLRAYKGSIAAGDARIIDAHMRNELGYCVIHDRYETPPPAVGPLGV